MQAYCVKCRAKKEMKDARAITMKNGKPATVKDNSINGALSIKRKIQLTTARITDNT